MADPRLESALKYAEKGWPVFPVNELKRPAIKDWENRASTDPVQIKAWFREKCLGGCNFGFCPGPAGIAVVDLDKEKKQKNGSAANGKESLRTWEDEHGVKLPDTYTVKTPSGGVHRYYRASDLTSKNGFLPAVDVKSCGGFVVIPGSTTEKGRYEVLRDLPVADLPREFIVSYGHRKKEKPRSSISYNTRITPDTEDKVEEAIRIVEGWPEAEEGERNDQLFRLMRELCKAGISMKKAEELYEEAALPKIGLDPDSREVAATIRSAYDDLSDLGSNSAEGRRLAARVFDDLPPLPNEGDLTGETKDWTELQNMNISERRWFIEDWLSADEGYTVLFSGRGGTGKSSLLLDLMRSLATGEPWCGMKVRRGSKSMYVGCEDSWEELARRIKMRPKDPPVPKGVIALESRLGKNNLLCTFDRTGKLIFEPFYLELLSRAKDFFGTSGGVLILDTASDMFAGNETDRSQVSQFVKNLLNRMGKEAGVTIILLAHPSKKASTDGQGYSGSTAWEGAFRCRWELNYKNPKKLDGLLELVLAKSNAAKAGRKVDLMNAGGTFLVVDGMKAEDDNKTELLRLIEEAYEEGSPFGTTAGSSRPIGNLTICDTITGSPLSEQEIKELVHQLLAERLIERYHTSKQRGLRPVKEGENREDE